MCEQEMIDVVNDICSRSTNYPIYHNPVFYIGIVAMALMVYETYMDNKNNMK